VEGDRCVFLNEQGLCRIHAKFGSEAKPFACQLYPYVLVPVGDHFRLSMRFACPSATRNLGRPVIEQGEQIRKFASMMEVWDRPEMSQADRDSLGPPPSLQRRQRVSWSDLELFVNALLLIMKEPDDSLPRRMLKVVALARACRQATFEKISGPRLREFLDLLRVAVQAEVPRNLDRIPAPGWIGRVLFRTFLAIYLRKDQGTRRGVRSRGWLPLMLAMGRMARGKGRLPMLQAGLPDKTFAHMEEPLGPLEPAAKEMLERYYQIKMESMQFCGPTFFEYGFWEGVESLALTLPAILWLARGYRDEGQAAAVQKAIQIVDENYAYSPLLGKSRQRYGLRILVFQRELDNLIAWYGR
jgi:lysine-N-methylase